MMNSGWGPMGRSAAVNTPRTPGAASAAAVSMASMRAWAMTERTKARCTVSGGAMSPT